MFAGLGKLAVKATVKATSLGHKIVKNKGIISMAIGTVGTITGTVLICKASTKVGEVTEAAKADIKKVKEETTEDKNKRGKALGKAYFRYGVALLKLYGPSILVLLSSIALMWGGFIFVKKDLTAMTAVATSLAAEMDRRDKETEKLVGRDIADQIVSGGSLHKVESKRIDEYGKPYTEEVWTYDNVDGTRIMRYCPHDCIGGKKSHAATLTMLDNLEDEINYIIGQRGRHSSNGIGVYFVSELKNRLGLDLLPADVITGDAISSTSPRRFVLGHRATVPGTDEYINKGYMNGTQDYLLLKPSFRDEPVNVYLG